MSWWSSTSSTRAREGVAVTSSSGQGEFRRAATRPPGPRHRRGRGACNPPPPPYPGTRSCPARPAGCQSGWRVPGTGERAPTSGLPHPRRRPRAASPPVAFAARIGATTGFEQADRCRDKPSTVLACAWRGTTKAPGAPVLSQPPLNCSSRSDGTGSSEASRGARSDLDSAGTSWPRAAGNPMPASSAAPRARRCPGGGDGRGGSDRRRRGGGRRGRHGPWRRSVGRPAGPGRLVRGRSPVTARGWPAVAVVARWRRRRLEHPAQAGANDARVGPRCPWPPGP
jgi:hypothetical protein